MALKVEKSFHRVPAPEEKSRARELRHLSSAAAVQKCSAQFGVAQLNAPLESVSDLSALDRVATSSVGAKIAWRPDNVGCADFAVAVQLFMADAIQPDVGWRGTGSSRD